MGCAPTRGGYTAGVAGDPARVALVVWLPHPGSAPCVTGADTRGRGRAPRRGPARAQGRGGGDAGERTADARRRGDSDDGDDAVRRQGEATRRRGDETTRRRNDDGGKNDAQANDDQNGIEQATVGPQGIPRLKQRGNDTNSDGEDGCKRISQPRPRRVALFNFYVASKSDYRFA